MDVYGPGWSNIFNVFLSKQLVSGVIFNFLLSFGSGADLSDTLMDRMVKHIKLLFLQIELKMSIVD